MIEAGKLNKTIQIQRLKRYKDEYFADVEEWENVFEAKASVKDYTEKDYRSIINDEVIITDRLVFTCRKYICKYLALDYRIVYRCRNFRILSIADESTDNIIILTELIQD